MNQQAVLDSAFVCLRLRVIDQTVMRFGAVKRADEDSRHPLSHIPHLCTLDCDKYLDVCDQEPWLQLHGHNAGGQVYCRCTVDNHQLKGIANAWHHVESAYE